MNISSPCILSINGGSSSIKFALFSATPELQQLSTGRITGIGSTNAKISVTDHASKRSTEKAITADDYASAVTHFMDWLEEHVPQKQLKVIGHRVVHGGPYYWQPQRITSDMIYELEQLIPFDPEHLPEELLLIKQCSARFPHLPSIACFDTAFHHAMPQVAQLLPIPREYFDKGVRRYGFHGLSYTFLLQELERIAGPEAAKGRVIMAHLGNGASVAATRDGQCIDTSMGFTPTAGLPMSNRSGDLDPGLAWYFAQTEHMSAAAFHHMINHESGLLGVSQISSNVRELLDCEQQEPNAAEALNLFCYQARKWLCAMASVLNGVDTIIFSGGIGENAPEIRERICTGLEFIGVQFDSAQNNTHQPVISSPNSSVTVRVIPTNEEHVIAQQGYQLFTTSVS